jgi:hypothetical protein
MGWWRRNRWWLVALVPVLAATVALNWGDVYDKHWRKVPHAPVGPAGDGSVQFAGARLRLTDLVPGAATLTDYAGKPYQPPAGMQVWRATIAFDTTRPDDIAGCEIALEDTAGRVYGANPQELARMRARFASCIPSTEDEGKAKFAKTAYFVTPADARPAAVRITLATQIPRSARLAL